MEQETLTFDISEFPQGHYIDKKEFSSYSGKVTAEYTFYNPTDYKVDATLVFPFGTAPDYGIIYDSEKESYTFPIDNENYAVIANGETIDKKLRHTLSLSGAQFELKTDLPKL